MPAPLPSSPIDATNRNSRETQHRLIGIDKLKRKQSHLQPFISDHMCKLVLARQEDAHICHRSQRHRHLLHRLRLVLSKQRAGASIEDDISQNVSLT